MTHPSWHTIIEAFCAGYGLGFRIELLLTERCGSTVWLRGSRNGVKAEGFEVEETTDE